MLRRSHIVNKKIFPAQFGHSVRCYGISTPWASTSKVWPGGTKSTWNWSFLKLWNILNTKRAKNDAFSHVLFAYRGQSLLHRRDFYEVGAQGGWYAITPYWVSKLSRKFFFIYNMWPLEHFLLSEKYWIVSQFLEFIL